MQLLQEDLNKAVDLIPSPLRAVMHEYGNRIFIAGGFLRSVVARESINDVDVFSQSGVDRFSLATRLNAHVHTTDNAFSIETTPTVQVIRGWLYDTPEACIDSFDFSICRAAIWSQNSKWHSVCSKNFYPDLAAKRLRYQKGSRCTASDVRVLKFYERGYTISASDFASIVMESAKLYEAGEVVVTDKPVTRMSKTY